MHCTSQVLGASDLLPGAAEGLRQPPAEPHCGQHHVGGTVPKAEQVFMKD